jgi:hypothetical protein
MSDAGGKDRRARRDAHALSSDKNGGSDGKKRHDKERRRSIDISREIKILCNATAVPRTQVEQKSDQMLMGLCPNNFQRTTRQECDKSHLMYKGVSHQRWTGSRRLSGSKTPLCKDVARRHPIRKDDSGS